MEKLDPQVDGASPNIVDQNIEELKKLFPEIVADGKVDFDVLREVLGDYVEDKPERYSFSWNGKSRARQIAQTQSMGTLRPCQENSQNWNTTKNLFIEGDNLEVLKLLQKAYHGRVNMIYIDPPYNTGNDLIYPDKYKESLETYLRYSGQSDAEGLKWSANAETSGRYHTNWLNMMYPRLKLAKNLLSRDGVIFVTIDDHEIHNLRHLMDEIFGVENFVACFLWKKMDSPSRNDEKRIVSEYHDYVVAYSRDESLRALSQMAKPEILDAYPLRLDDGRLARRRQLRKNGKGARRKDRPTMWFELTAPDGTSVWPVAPPPDSWEGRWVLSKDTWHEREEAGLTQWIQRDYGWVPYYIELAPENPGVPWSTWWDDLDQNRQAKAKFTSLMESTGFTFDNPKPENLVERMLQILGKEDALILDFFAGSGTTGHAVMARNSVDGGNRRFILVQLPEPIEDSVHNIADLSRKRLIQAASQIREQSAEESEGSIDLDLGFRSFRLDSSNIKQWEGEFEHTSESLLDAVENVKDDRSEEDVLYEILLKYGIDLSSPVETREVAGQTVAIIGGGALICCLTDDVSLDLIEGIADIKDEIRPELTRIVFRDSGFKDDVIKTNAVQILRQRGIEDVKSL